MDSTYPYVLTSSLKSDHRKADDYRPDDYRPDDYRPDDYCPDDYCPDDYRPPKMYPAAVIPCIRSGQTIVSGRQAEGNKVAHPKLQTAVPV